MKICDRTLGAGGPALIFDNPSAQTIPVLANLFGAPRRAALGMGADDVGQSRRIGQLPAILKEPEAPEGLRDASGLGSMLKSLWKSLWDMAPTEVRAGGRQEIGWDGDDVDLARLLIQHRWPGEDINDILSGVDEVVKKGFVDSERLGVIGGSGGGLMTSWMVTQTSRFKAAVAWWPVTNWITHVGVGDNGFYISSVYRKAMPWEDPDDYIRHSPLFQVGKVKTPTMVMCGEEDWRVPIAQSEEFYRALKVRGVPTVFIRYPGESHGVLKRTSHRMNVLAHSLAWLDRYTGLAQ